MSGGPTLSKRSSGILLHPTSLPGPYGCGDLGPEAYKFADFLADAGQRWWQTLPINPADKHGCPYSAYSAFAGDPTLISLELLYRDGLLSRADIKRFAGINQNKVDYAAVRKRREPLLKLAYESFVDGPKRNRDAMAKFHEQHKAWLDDWAMFSALRYTTRNRPWWKWPDGIRKRRKADLQQAREHLADKIDYSVFLQYQFDKQWNALKKHCKNLGIGLIGDIPIFVAQDSCDVWANPELFLLKADGRPKVISGAPPDAFSKTGQLWKHPLYDWDKHKASGYAWWVERFRRCLTQYDTARIDHFLGFCRFWAVPAEDKDARRGKWRKGPGADLFQVLKRRLGSVPIIAEDLGVLTAEAEALRDQFKFPGMRVLQFAFGEDDTYYMPHNYHARSVVYTGTHDNDTARGWFLNAGRKPDKNGLSERKRILSYTGGSPRTIHQDLIRLTLSSVSNTAIFPVQDLLGLDSRGRMNIPGTLRGNWTWRLKPGQLKKSHARWLAAQTALFGRA